MRRGLELISRSGHTKGNAKPRESLGTRSSLLPYDVVMVREVILQHSDVVGHTIRPCPRPHVMATSCLGIFASLAWLVT